MADRARRAKARAQRRQKAAEAVVAGQERVNEEDSDDNEEIEEVPVRFPQRMARGPAVAPQLALDPGMWMNMVNVKPPNLPDLEIESMKKWKKNLFVFLREEYVVLRWRLRWRWIQGCG